MNENTLRDQGQQIDERESLQDAPNLDDGSETYLGGGNEDVIPTAIVIKNIPFVIKKEQLLEVIAKMNLPLPYAFNYHFDNGVFRGLAFANFATTDETTQVVSVLNGKEIGGRKLRVEYKKMLPQAERERIEREKREKRGQLEEQHRSISNLSLQFMNKQSMSGNNVANNQLPSNFISGSGTQTQCPQQHTVSTSGPHRSHISQNNNPSILPPTLSQVPSHQHQILTERYYAPLPSTTSLPLPPQQLDFNDPDTLEIYSQLLLFKDREKLYHELAYPTGLSANHKRIINVLCSFLGLVEVYDPSFIIIRRKTLENSVLQSHLQQVQVTMIQPLQPSSTGGSISRSQSYTSLLQAHASTIANQRPQSPNQSLLQPSTLHQDPNNLTPQQLHQQQSLLRQQASTSSILSNRIPSGYTPTTSHLTSSFLRQPGVSPPTSQTPMNNLTSGSKVNPNTTISSSNKSHRPSQYSQTGIPSIVNEQRFANHVDNIPLLPQHTNSSMQSNYSVHSIHDYVPGVASNANNSNTSQSHTDLNFLLEDGLNKSLSGLDLVKKNLWG